MSLTTAVLLIYAVCLVGTIASPSSPPTSGTDGKGSGFLPVALLVPGLALLALAGPIAAARAADLPSTPVPPRTVSGPATVIDGATLAIDGRRVRLHGIDAPDLDQTCFDARERGYACGRTAAEALAARIGGQAIACEARPDETGTDTALCRLGQEDLAAWMVGNGYAVAARSGADYEAEDQRAWGRRLGLWAGVFERPADRRRLRGMTAGL